MNTNEKICKWLGLKYHKEPYYDWFIKVLRDPDGRAIDTLDFLHDRNQQKWIIDELTKRGYRIKLYICEQVCEVKIWHNDNQTEVIGDNEDLDLAFILAVEQLIDKENDIQKKQG